MRVQAKLSIASPYKRGPELNLKQLVNKNEFILCSVRAMATMKYVQY